MCSEYKTQVNKVAFGFYGRTRSHIAVYNWNVLYLPVFLRRSSAAGNAKLRSNTITTQTIQ